MIALIDELGRFDVVGVAKTGPEAIDEVAELRPAVLILDMAMPGGNGYAVLQAVKQQQPAPLVIVLTQYPHPSYREKCLALGAALMTKFAFAFGVPVSIFAAGIGTGLLIP